MGKKFLKWLVDLEDERGWRMKGNTDWDTLAHIIFLLYSFLVLQERLGFHMKVVLREKEEMTLIHAILFSSDFVLPEGWHEKINKARNILQAFASDVLLEVERRNILV